MQLEFFYDFSCPYAYLASTQIERVAASAGAELIYKPFLLGGVFRAIGAQDMTSLPPARARLNGLDMLRWAEHWSVPFSMPPGHPNRTVLALRAALASDDLPRASHALFSAYWAEGKNLSEPAVVAEALDAAGMNGHALVERANDEGIKRELRTRTDEAIARGVFGAPTCFVGAERFWGQDRLDFVARALGDSPAAPAIETSRPPRVSSFEFWYDFSSPFAYLAATQVEAIAARSGARVLWRPFLLGALFRAIGTADVPLFTFPEAKQSFARQDMQRWALHYGVPFRFPSRFPMRSVSALRLVLLSGDAADRLSCAVFRAYWADDRDIADPGVLAELCTEVGVDPALVDRVGSDEAKLALRQATDEAVERGLCGAPSFVVGQTLFWGQDRLHFVEKALAGWQPLAG